MFLSSHRDNALISTHRGNGKATHSMHRTVTAFRPIIIWPSIIHHLIIMTSTRCNGTFELPQMQDILKDDPVVVNCLNEKRIRPRG